MKVGATLVVARPYRKRYVVLFRSYPEGDADTGGVHQGLARLAMGRLAHMQTHLFKGAEPHVETG